MHQQINGNLLQTIFNYPQKSFNSTGDYRQMCKIVVVLIVASNVTFCTAANIELKIKEFLGNCNTSEHAGWEMAIINI